METLFHQNTTVVSGAYNMIEDESPVFMSPCGTVAFSGYGVADEAGTLIQDDHHDNDYVFNH